MSTYDIHADTGEVDHENEYEFDGADIGDAYSHAPLVTRARKIYLGGDGDGGGSHDGKRCSWCWRCSNAKLHRFIFLGKQESWIRDGYEYKHTHTQIMIYHPHVINNKPQIRTRDGLGDEL